MQFHPTFYNAFYYFFLELKLFRVSKRGHMSYNGMTGTYFRSYFMNTIINFMLIFFHTCYISCHYNHVHIDPISTRPFLRYSDSKCAKGTVRTYNSNQCYGMNRLKLHSTSMIILIGHWVMGSSLFTGDSEKPLNPVWVSVFYQRLGKFVASGNRFYFCNAFSPCQRPCSVVHRKRVQKEKWAQSH